MSGIPDFLYQTNLLIKPVVLNFNIYNCLIIAGIIQGIVFFLIVLFSRKYKDNSTIALGFLVLSYALGNLQYILADVGLLSLISMYIYIYLPLASLIPAIIFFYTNLFLYPSREIGFKLKLVFLPFVFFLLITMIFRTIFVFSDIQTGIFESYSFFIHFVEIFSIAFTLILLTILISKVRIFKKHQNSFSTNKINTNVSWLEYTLYTMFFFTLVWAYLIYENLYIKNGETSFYLLWVAIATTIYWLGHAGIYKYGIIEERKKLRQYSANIKRNNFKKEGTGSEHIIRLENLLVNQKFFLDPNLTLDNVAKKLNISPAHLSRIVKRDINTSFGDYINKLRVNEAKEYLKNPEFSRYTITAIGLEAGFNSKSAFYDVFKKQTGQTPLAYKKEALN